MLRDSQLTVRLVELTLKQRQKVRIQASGFHSPPVKKAVNASETGHRTADSHPVYMLHIDKSAGDRDHNVRRYTTASSARLNCTSPQAQTPRFKRAHIYFPDKR
ncbi:hypothetical protein AMECASPLE_022393 [Ameca splendens]|uniref:Uncharacterized protein n=1 Tax=Ameca splendens TaxID=208324 RepID=A0ABV0ZZD1_9TELE